MNKKLIALALIIAFAGVAFAGGTVGWVQLPTDATGWYWGYDDDDDPPFDNPPVPALPDADEGEIWDNPAANKLAPYNDRPWQYTLVDSFWFYNHWYRAGNHCFFSPDGWISFDEAGVDGFPHPPSASPPIPNTDDPNELIAPLWQDNDPTENDEPDDENRVYYMWNGGDRTLTVQWHNVNAFSSDNEYDYACQLQFGGQDLLYTDECGVLFSNHFIHFMYLDADDWTGEDGVAGIEDINGEAGVCYHEPDDENIHGDGVVRFGYKFIRSHDVIPVAFIAPGQMVLRWTDLEPWVVVGNIGKETETFNIVLDIYDDDESRVYHNVVSGFHVDSDEIAVTNMPCWTPGELYEEGIHYYRKELIVSLDGDQCLNNDTLIEMSWVHCDDSLGYEWNFNLNSGSIGWSNFAFPVLAVQGTSYRFDGGVLLLGARAWLWQTDYIKNYPPPYGPLRDFPRVEAWKGSIPTEGCGRPGYPGPTSDRVGYGICETYQDGWNWAFIAGRVGPRITDLPGNTGELVEDLGTYVTAAYPEGNIWAALNTSGYGESGEGTGGYARIGLLVPPEPTICYGGHPLCRSAYWYVDHYHEVTNYGSWGAWIGYPYSIPIELIVHLGFTPDNPQPSPPCYYDEPHDLSIYRINKPDNEFIEDGIPITAELALANLGRQNEPDEEFFPVKMFINDLDNGNDTVFAETTNVAEIGCFADELVEPDTMFIAILPWTPEGICVDWQEESYPEYPSFEEVGRHYELIGLVRLGEVGPDLSDHCPYNDTCRKFLTCLLSHDVGVIDLVDQNGNAWGNTQADAYPVGTVFDCLATVENFGFNEEHDVPVDLEIYDVDADPDSLVWHNIQVIEHLDWRGNDLGNPYREEVDFPDFDTPSENWFRFECRTELVGDQCPENDEVTRQINLGIAEDVTPTPFALEAIVPNPFVGSTKVSFAVPVTTKVSLKVYDISGKLVTTLVDGNQNPGRHSVTWSGTDGAGRTVAQGIYLVRMEAESFSATKKVVLY